MAYGWGRIIPCERSTLIRKIFFKEINMEIKDFIKKFAEQIEVENLEQLTPQTEFRELDEWSSLSVMLLIAFFDEEFEKGIGDNDIKSCHTIQDLFNLATA